MSAKMSLYGLAIAVLGAFLLHACSKEKAASEELPAGQQQVSLYLTDDPAYFDQVLVDIRSVQVLLDTCSRNRDDDDDDNDRGWGRDERKDCIAWQQLDIEPGVYDLLSLRNGADTLLANGLIPEGKIKSIRIELGSENSLVKDSVTYPLKLFPGVQSTIIIQVRGKDWDEYATNRWRLWLDFDVARSVIRVHDGLFYLKPVIHLFTVKATGGLSGLVLPYEAYPVVSVFNAQDTGYAIPWRNGLFKVRGLQEGTYSVYVNASNGYQDTTITGIEIRRGRETSLEAIHLHQ